MKQIVKTSLAAGASVIAVVGLVLAPTLQVSAVSNPSSTTINATIAPVITISSGATVAFTMTPTGAFAESNGSNVVTVSTNNTLGYNLTLADSDATLTLLSGANTIAASANTFAAPAVLALNSWGYGVAALGTFSASYSSQTDVTTSTLKYAGILATPATIKTTGAPASGDTTTVWYGAKVDTSKPTGVYTDTVTYTATTI